jgi:hypothetical protein
MGPFGTSTRVSLVVGITASHFYRQYLSDLQKFSNVEAQFNRNAIYPAKVPHRPPAQVPSP